MAGWWPTIDFDPPSLPDLIVTDEANEVVATLLGPDGEVVSVLFERPVIDMGFHPGKRTGRWVRREEADD